MIKPFVLSYEQRQDFSCEICGNVPDEEGWIHHGKGCYTQSPDGGGDELIEEAAPVYPDGSRHGVFVP